MTELVKHIVLEDGRDMVVFDYRIKSDNTIEESEWDDWDDCTTTYIPVKEVLNVYYLHVSARLCVDEQGNEVLDYEGFPEYSYVVLCMDDRGNTLYSDSGIRSVRSKYTDYNINNHLEREVMRNLDLLTLLS